MVGRSEPGHVSNAIKLVECTHDSLCCGFRWLITDEEALAQLVAWTMQGHYRHAEQVLRTLMPSRIPIRQTISQQAISRLQLPPGTANTAPRWHRDGLVFQHIAWLAAMIGSGQEIAATMPHLVPAHKGFDALLVPLDGVGRASSGIIICEEKATANPRSKITSEVWPSIVSLEKGERDAELNGELTAILERYNVQNIEEIITEANWLNRKVYRVSITIAPEHDDDESRSALFSGFESKAPGDVSRRRAETLKLQHLRKWMDKFCGKVVNHIKGA